MTKRPIWILLVAVAAVLSLAATACGDDDTTNASTDSSSTTATTAKSDSEQAAEDVAGAALGGKCSFLGEIAGAGFEQALDPTALMGSGQGEVDFGKIYGPLAEQFSQVADAAPDDIADAFHTLADGFNELADQLKGVSIDFSDPQSMDQDALAKLSEVGATLDTTEFQNASDEIDAWIKANCDVSADG